MKNINQKSEEAEGQWQSADGDWWAPINHVVIICITCTLLFAFSSSPQALHNGYDTFARRQGCLVIYGPQCNLKGCGVCFSAQPKDVLFHLYCNTIPSVYAFP